MPRLTEAAPPTPAHTTKPVTTNSAPCPKNCAESISSSRPIRRIPKPSRSNSAITIALAMPTSPQRASSTTSATLNTSTVAWSRNLGRSSARLSSVMPQATNMNIGGTAKAAIATIGTISSHLSPSKSATISGAAAAMPHAVAVLNRPVPSSSI